MRGELPPNTPSSHSKCTWMSLVMLKVVFRGRSRAPLNFGRSPRSPVPCPHQATYDHPKWKSALSPIQPQTIESRNVGLLSSVYMCEYFRLREEEKPKCLSFGAIHLSFLSVVPRFMSRDHVTRRYWPHAHGWLPDSGAMVF